MIISRGGGVRLSPPLALLVLAPVFAWIGLGVGIAGARAVAGGAPGGLVPILVALACLGVLFAQCRVSSPLCFDRDARIVRFSWPSFRIARVLRARGTGRRRLSFDEIESIAVLEGRPASAPLALVLAGSSEDIPIGSGWTFADAVQIARAVATATGRPAGLRSGATERTLAPLPSPAGGETRHPPRLPLVVFRSAAAAVTLFGVVAFLGGLAVTVAGGRWLDRVELPLGDAEGLAVDSQGRIYVGSRAYHRVQRYGTDGGFDRAWTLCPAKGAIRLEAGADRPAFWVGGTHCGDVDAEDRLVGAGRAPGERRAGLDSGATRDSRGAVFRLEAAVYRPARVIRTAPEPHETVMRQPVSLWLAQSPLPAGLFALAGILLQLLAEGFERRSAAVAGSERR